MQSCARCSWMMKDTYSISADRRKLPVPAQEASGTDRLRASRRHEHGDAFCIVTARGSCGRSNNCYPAVAPALAPTLTERPTRRHVAAKAHAGWSLVSTTARTDELHFGGTRVDGGGHDAAPLPGPARALTRGERPARADEHREAERATPHTNSCLCELQTRVVCASGCWPRHSAGAFTMTAVFLGPDDPRLYGEVFKGASGATASHLPAPWCVRRACASTPSTPQCAHRVPKISVSGPLVLACKMCVARRRRRAARSSSWGAAGRRCTIVIARCVRRTNDGCWCHGALRYLRLHCTPTTTPASSPHVTARARARTRDEREGGLRLRNTHPPFPPSSRSAGTGRSCTSSCASGTSRSSARSSSSRVRPRAVHTHPPRNRGVQARAPTLPPVTVTRRPPAPLALTRRRHRVHPVLRGHVWLVRRRRRRAHAGAAVRGARPGHHGEHL